MVNWGVLSTNAAVIAAAPTYLSRRYGGVKDLPSLKNAVPNMIVKDVKTVAKLMGAYHRLRTAVFTSGQRKAAVVYAVGELLKAVTISSSAPQALPLRHTVDSYAFDGRLAHQTMGTGTVTRSTFSGGLSGNAAGATSHRYGNQSVRAGAVAASRMAIHGPPQPIPRAQMITTWRRMVATVRDSDHFVTWGRPCYVGVARVNSSVVLDIPAEVVNVSRKEWQRLPDFDIAHVPPLALSPGNPEHEPSHLGVVWPSESMGSTFTGVPRVSLDPNCTTFTDTEIQLPWIQGEMAYGGGISCQNKVPDVAGALPKGPSRLLGTGKVHRPMPDLSLRAPGSEAAAWRKSQLKGKPKIIIRCLQYRGPDSWNAFKAPLETRMASKDVVAAPFTPHPSAHDVRGTVHAVGVAVGQISNVANHGSFNKKENETAKYAQRVLDITSVMLRDRQSSKLEVRLGKNENVCRGFVMYSVEVVHELDADAMTALAERRLSSLPTPGMMTGADDSDSDIIQNVVTMPLRDVIIGERIDIPVKTIHCSHVHHMDLHAFITFTENTTMWNCYLCRARAFPADLRINHQLRKFLRATSEELMSAEYSKTTGQFYDPRTQTAEGASLTTKVVKSTSSKPKTVMFTIESDDDDDDALLAEASKNVAEGSKNMAGASKNMAEASKNVAEGSKNVVEEPKNVAVGCWGDALPSSPSSTLTTTRRPTAFPPAAAALSLTQTAAVGTTALSAFAAAAPGPPKRTPTPSLSAAIATHATGAAISTPVMSPATGPGAAVFSRATPSATAAAVATTPADNNSNIRLFVMSDSDSD